MADDVAGLSFEDALGELERIVRGLEGGQQKLEDAITCYERGAALRRHCEQKLAEAETRVQAIVERGDGTVGVQTLAEPGGADQVEQGGQAGQVFAAAAGRDAGQGLGMGFGQASGQDAPQTGARAASVQAAG